MRKKGNWRPKRRYVDIKGRTITRLDWWNTYVLRWFGIRLLRVVWPNKTAWAVAVFVPWSAGYPQAQVPQRTVRR